MRQRPHPRRKLGSETLCLRLNPLTVQHSAVLVVKEHFRLLTSEHYCLFMHAHVQGPTMSLPLYRSFSPGIWVVLCTSSVEHSVHSYICTSIMKPALQRITKKCWVFWNKGREELYIAPKQEGLLLKSSLHIFKFYLKYVVLYVHHSLLNRN